MTIDSAVNLCSVKRTLAAHRCACLLPPCQHTWVFVRPASSMIIPSDRPFSFGRLKTYVVVSSS